QLRLDIAQVNPSQFLGIEINPRAAAIADLVIWIGYLQWHFRRFGDIPPIEPVLREYNNIKQGDAVLAYDGREPDVDATGKVRTRWGGRMMKSPVTGENVPDPTNQVTIYRYLNARAAEWQDADYIVSNPPFIGNRQMREMLGDGYTETLRKVYKDVPDTVDFVMYWWHKAAVLVQARKTQRFGLITTNTIRQVRQRVVLDLHLNPKNKVQLFFAIPDHPWSDGDANVRIAMTGAELNNFPKMAQKKFLGVVTGEDDEDTPESTADRIQVRWSNPGQIFNDLRAGVNLSLAVPIKAQTGLCSDGVKPYGSGFILNAQEVAKFSSKEKELIRVYRNGRDIAQNSRDVYIIDCYGLSEQQVQDDYPNLYQLLLERVYPERIVERDNKIKKNWFLFERNRPELRATIQKIKRYIVTIKTAKHRSFIFVESNILPDQQLVTIALDDAYFLGVLSSQVHVTWSLAAGGRLGVGNDPRYNNSVCFDPFPFPDPTDTQKQTIRELGERLDRHRKRVQTTHPEVTITGMYNLLEKLRQGEPLDDKDKAFNQKALVSTLKQI
ncbi:class I SAM-dependent DNA methyltransferase, partial [Microcoleus sp. herbarium19]